MATVEESRQQAESESYRKHVAGKLRTTYPSIADATDDELFGVWHRLNIPDADADEAEAVLQKVYGSDWEPPEYKPTLGERAQAVGTAIKQIPGAIKESFASPVTAARAAGEGRDIERIASEMPAPNIAELRQKGYSNEQIRNIVLGYSKTQESLAQDLAAAGKTGIESTAEAAATYGTLPLAGARLAALGGRAAGAALGKTGVKAGLAQILKGGAAEAARGAGLGAAYGAVKSPIVRASEAVAEGKGADNVYKAITGGITEGATEMLGPGAAVGSVFGMGGAVISRSIAQSAARKAVAEKAVADAARMSYRNFAESFQPQWLHERFSDEMQRAAGAPDEVLAMNIFKRIHGDAAVQSEDGLRAVSDVARKIKQWRSINEGLRGPMIDLPAQVTPEGAATTLGGVPNAQMAAGISQQGMPVGAPLGPTGGLAPEPHLPPAVQGPLGERAPAFEPPGTPPPAMAGIEQMPALQQQQVPLTLEGPAPIERVPGPVTTPAPVLGAESLRPVLPTEYAVRELGQPTLTPRTPPAELALGTLPGREPNQLVEGARRAMEIAGTPEELARFEAAQRGLGRRPGEGNVDVLGQPMEAPRVVGAAVEPREIILPTRADDVAATLKDEPNIEITGSPSGKELVINKLGVKAAEISTPGASSKALARASAIADDSGMPIIAHVSPQTAPKGGTIPLEKLIPWYEEHGFTVIERGEGSAVLRREPLNPAIAERIQGLTREQAQVASGNVTPGQALAQGSVGTRIEKFLNIQADAARKRIATRKIPLSESFNTAKLAAAELADHAIITAATMFTKGLRTKTAVRNWLTETYGDVVQPHVDAIFDAAQKRLMRMFKTEGNMNSKLKELVALRDSGKHGADWYEDTSAWVMKTFGEQDGDMFLRFLALTSADNSTEAGSALAVKAFSQWKHGLPFDGMRGPHMVKMLNEAVRGDKFGGDKIYNFYRALSGDKDAVVLDRWMIKALGLPMKKGSLGESDYKLYAQIVRDLAAEANMSPRQLQAAIWEGARVGTAHAYERAGGQRSTVKMGSARPLEQILDRMFGFLTPRQWVENNKMNLEKLTTITAGMKAAREQGGFTFDPKTWEADKTQGFIVTLATEVVPKSKFYPIALTRFKKNFQKILDRQGGPHVNLGTWKMEDGKKFSLDLNVVIPDGPNSLEQALLIGRQNRQFAIGHIDEAGNFTEHKTGYNPKKHGPQFTPPEKPGERVEWLKKTQGRVNSLLDLLDFKLVSANVPPLKPNISAWKPGQPLRLTEGQTIGTAGPDVRILRAVSNVLMDKLGVDANTLIRHPDYVKARVSDNPMATAQNLIVKFNLSEHDLAPVLDKDPMFRRQLAALGVGRNKQKLLGE